MYIKFVEASDRLFLEAGEQYPLLCFLCLLRLFLSSYSFAAIPFLVNVSLYGSESDESGVG
jgi:hypothetical protein